MVRKGKENGRYSDREHIFQISLIDFFIASLVIKCIKGYKVRKSKNCDRITSMDGRGLNAKNFLVEIALLFCSRKEYAKNEQ